MESTLNSVLYCDSSMMNNAFIESFEEEYSGHRILPPLVGGIYSKIADPEDQDEIREKSSYDASYKFKISKEISMEELRGTPAKVLESVSKRKFFYPHTPDYEIENRGIGVDDCSLNETNKFCLSRRSSEFSNPFSPLEDISNFKFSQSKEMRKTSDNEFLVFSSTPVDIEAPIDSKENVFEVPNFNSKTTKNKTTKSMEVKPLNEIQKSFGYRKLNACKQTPVLNRNNGSKIPFLKSKQSNLKTELLLTSTNNEKASCKRLSEIECFTPNPTIKRPSKRISIQIEKKLREDRQKAENNSRKSTSELIRKCKDTNQRQQGKISGKVSADKVLPNILKRLDFEPTRLIEVSSSESGTNLMLRCNLLTKISNGGPSNMQKQCPNSDVLETVEANCAELMSAGGNSGILKEENLSNFKKQCRDTNIAKSVKENCQEQCSDLVPASLKEKLKALETEPGIAEISDLTLCSNTVHFSRVFEQTFDFPTKTSNKI